MSDITHNNSGWARLRRHTQARIGLAATGAAVATSEHLAFQFAHAQARDAVHDALDIPRLVEALNQYGLDPLIAESRARDRRSYLLRPDLGRRLEDGSRKRLATHAAKYDLSIVCADGLSARAVQSHAAPLLSLVIPTLRHQSWRLAPCTFVAQGRVAIGDEIGEVLGAGMVAVLIGERPGLTSPDSLGVYVTWAPAIGRRDSERNCLSNIRPQGLDYAGAAAKLLYLLNEGRRRRLTGVQLKDQAGSALPA
jgi:ethanolamine ammonia-lyase small subunit